MAFVSFIFSVVTQYIFGHTKLDVLSFMYWRITLENMYAATGTNLEQLSDNKATYDPQFLAFSGRIGRVRYLAYQSSAVLLCYLATSVVFAMMFSLGVRSTNPTFMMFLPLLVVLLIFICSFVFMRRRLNDIGHSGWFAILAFVPFVNFLFSLYLVFAPGSEGINQYGPAPSKNTTGVILCSLLFPFFFVIGILAAIALPAYKEYTARAKAAETQIETP